MAGKRINTMTRIELEALGRRMNLTGLRNIDFPELRLLVRNTYARNKNHPKQIKDIGKGYR